MNRGHSFLPSTVVVASILVAVAVPKLAGCGDSEGRLGALGESCTRTDDCESPLVCRALVCTDPNDPSGSSSSSAAGTGGAGATTSSSTAGPSSSSSGAGGSGSSSSSGGSSSSGPISSSACDDCLDTACAEEEAACDADCIGIEACIQSVCLGLSTMGSPEEGQCQVYCQNQFPGAKPRHLDVANCAGSAGGGCNACSSFPFDLDACRQFMTANACAPSWNACQASPECQSYRDCLFVCDDLAACLACDDTPQGASGRALLEPYEKCIASECIAEAWVP